MAVHEMKPDIPKGRLTEGELLEAWSARAYRKPPSARKGKGQGPDPATYAKAGTEHAHQVALFMWAAQTVARGQYPELRRMFAIPNGGERNIRVAARLRAEGVKKGVLDIFLPVPIAAWHGLFIELKRPKSDERKKGVVEPEQADWITYLQSVGYGAVTCYGWESARDTLIAYLTWADMPKRCVKAALTIIARSD